MVVAVDSFGNLITNFSNKEVEPLAEASKLWLELGKKKPSIRGLVSSYSSVEEGKFLALGGSSGFVEVSVRNGNASVKAGLKEGDPITLLFRN